MFIDGRWVLPSQMQLLDVVSPVTGEVIARIPDASARVVAEGIAVAAASQTKIRRIPGIERARIFQRASQLVQEHEEELVRVIQAEAGKPDHDAHGEVNAVVNRLQLVLEEARKIFGEYIPGDWSEDSTGRIALVIREPLGVVVAISAFNYPLYFLATKLVPALLA